MKRIEIIPFIVPWQQQMMFYGRRVGYCGTKPGDPLSFLIDRDCRLTDDEKREVIQYVTDAIGRPQSSFQTEHLFPHEDAKH